MIAAIAAATVREAARNRLPWLLGLLMLAAIGIGGFLRDLALTESRDMQTVLIASVLRLASVYLIATFVVSSVAREAQDKGRELLLAMAMPRATWLLGRYAGFALVALWPAILFGALAMLLSPAAPVWAASLACELWMVAAFALLCAISLPQVPALLATAGFYLLARSAASLSLLAHGPFDSTSQRVMGHIIEAIAAVLPALDQFARSDWLVYGGAANGLLQLGQTVVYCSLLIACALFDLYRKEL